jgi:hypothetical protein
LTHDSAVETVKRSGPLVAFAVVIGLGLVAVGAMPPAAQGTAQAAPVVIPAKFDTGSEHVLIPVTIGGRQFWCNPDTGYSAIVALDRAKAVAAGLPLGPGIPTADGNPSAPGARSTRATMVVGGVTYPDYPIIVRPFANTCSTWTASWAWPCCAASSSNSTT